MGVDGGIVLLGEEYRGLRGLLAFVTYKGSCGWCRG